MVNYRCKTFFLKIILAVRLFKAASFVAVNRGYIWILNLEKIIFSILYNSKNQM